MIYEELMDYTRDSTPCLIMRDVCQHWKNVVQNFPSLWTIIRVPEFRIDMDDEAIERQANLLSLALSLSSSMPLAIKNRYLHKRAIDDSDETLSEEAILTLQKRAECYAARMMTALVSEHDRWSQMDISFDHALFLHFHLLRQQFRNTSENLTGIGKNLQKLYVRLYGEHWECKSLDDFFSWLREPVALEMLVLRDSTPHFILQDITPVSNPLSGIPIVAFIREDLTFEDCVNVMLHCSTSNEVWLFGEDLANEQLDTIETSQIHDTLHGPELKTLEARVVRLMAVESPFDLLNGFTMPNLVELIIASCHHPSLGEHETLANFLDRSQCHLTRLVIREDYLRENEVLSFLRIPALQKVPEVDFSQVRRFSNTSKGGDSKNVNVEGSNQSLLLQGMNFKMWRNSKEKVFSGFYHYGWKELKSGEEVAFICKDGNVVQC